MIADVIAGARPNFVKVAALFAVANDFPDLHLRFIHTGQHYDARMSKVFLEELALPPPCHELKVGSGTHAAQTAETMMRYEAWTQANRPDLSIVVGDVNSTLGCALAAAKQQIPVAHIEAGLRSFDRRMPEEINRLLVDALSALMFATEPSAVGNLAREGRPEEQIHLVGNVMIDTLLHHAPRANDLQFHKHLGLQRNAFAYLTLHRPSNVDDNQRLRDICQEICWLAEQLPVVFALHPRTRLRLEAVDQIAILQNVPALYLIEPTSYLESLSLLMNARCIITDSGGIQEESSALGVPCLTIRDTTERPITLTDGTNVLIGDNWPLFRACVEDTLLGKRGRKETHIPYWDGQAGRRIMTILQAVSGLSG